MSRKTTAMPEVMEDTYAAEEAAAARANRAQFIANIRALADLFDQHPDLPRPSNIYVTVYASEDDARAGRRGIPGWHKQNSPESSYVTYSKVLGGSDSWSENSVTLDLEVNKADTCTRIQTGTRHIEAQPAADIPVYVWDCGGRDEAPE